MKWKFFTVYLQNIVYRSFGAVVVAEADFWLDDVSLDDFGQYDIPMIPSMPVIFECWPFKNVF